MGVDDVAGDGQPQPCAAGAAVAGPVGAGEPIEDPLAVRVGHTRTVIGDDELGFRRCPLVTRRVVTVMVPVA